MNRVKKSGMICLKTGGYPASILERGGTWLVLCYEPGAVRIAFIYEGWNFNSGNYLFTTDTK